MLKNKVMLITGSSSGIGEATARLAKSYGAEVILHGKTDSGQLKNLAKELECEYIFCDVSDKNVVNSEVERILVKVKKIDILVNCAGIFPRYKLLDSTDEQWEEMFKINVLGTVHFCQAVVPQMRKNKYGRIVNIASIRGHVDTSGRAVYSASKAAIVNLTSTMAKEFAPTISVNAVSPGFTETATAANVWDEEVWKQVRTSLLNRAGNPEEIAEVVLFLASDRASFITGQTIIVDGGYSMSGK